MTSDYRFLVRGHLDDRWSEWLGGLSIQRTEDGCSVLTGPVADQAALHGVIGRIRDLGLPLLAVECASDRCEELAPRASSRRHEGVPVRPTSRREDSDLTGDVSDRTNDIEGGTSCD